MAPESETLYYNWPAVRHLISTLETEGTTWGGTVRKLLETPGTVDYAQVKIAEMLLDQNTAVLHELRQLLGYWEHHHATDGKIPVQRQVMLLLAAIYAALLLALAIYVIGLGHG